MEAFETQNTFRKLRLDTSHTQHTGSSSLSLSLCNQDSKSPTPITPISIRLSQPRTFDTYHHQCTEPLDLSSSGRYAQSGFALSPLERAARAGNSALFQPRVAEESAGKRDHRQKPVLPTLYQEQAIPQPTPKVQDGGLFFGKKSLPVRSNTESEKFNYDLSSGRRREPANSIVDSFIRESGAVQDEDREDDYDSRPSYRAIEPSSLMSQPRRRFLSPSPFVSLMEDQDRMSSLTSDSTVGSPLSEALATPTDSECSDIYGHPLFRTTRCQSFQDPLSLEETSAWSGDLHRNKSYNFEILPPVGGRRKRRAFSEKRLSPANQFLSGWSLQKAPEPDDEGQEVGAYVVGKQIGFGGFSVVKEVTTMLNGIKIKRAVKIVRKQAHNAENENDKIQAEFDHEVSIWRYLNHPNILPLIEVYDTPHATFCFTKLVTNGTLWDLLKQNRQGLPVQTARKYAYQLASALRYLHEDVRIIHSDVKLENCLIDVSADGEGNLLLCDFGMADQMPGSTDDDDLDSTCSYGSKLRRRNTTTDIKGSLQYCSPEMMAITAPPLSAAVDMWAYGVVVYALLVGELPFNHSFQPKLQMMIAKGDWNIAKFRNAEPFIRDDENSAMALAVVKGCLCKNIERRWSIDMVLDSEWLNEFVEDSC